MDQLKRHKELLMDGLSILAGSAVYAAAVNGLTAPNNIAPGGVTGVCTMLNYMFGTPIGLMVILINLPIIIWAIIEIGYKLVIKTIVAIAISSVLIDLFAGFMPVYRGEEFGLEADAKMLYWSLFFPAPVKGWGSLLPLSEGQPPEEQIWWPGCWSGECLRCLWES